MASSKKISAKDYQEKILKLKKIEEELKIANKKLIGNEDNFSNKAKLRALDRIIGYLVRNGKESGLPMEVLIDIANDYQKKVDHK